MANIFLISDTHFGHENIIKYCARPFADAQEMDEVLIARWNAVVRPQDHVYHLGDVAMRRDAMDRVMPRLVGHLRLVRGNHDIFKTKDYLKYFDEIYGVRVLDNWLMSHIPVHPENLGRFRGNLHGHIHEKAPYEGWTGRYVNLSVEQINYTPVPLESIRR